MGFSMKLFNTTKITTKFKNGKMNYTLHLQKISNITIKQKISTMIMY